VTLEGPEGAGKTTQAARLRDALDAAGVSVVLVREPGGTTLGESIRSLLLDMGPEQAPDSGISARADALLFNAARAQLVQERIEPALASGTTVICSRFADSTLAYQGAGMGLPTGDLASLERFATGGLKPDLTLLLDLPVEVGLARKRGEETRFESGFDVAFHRRVRAGFLELARGEPERFVTLDATAAPDAVFRAIRYAVEQRIGVVLEPGPRVRPGAPGAGSVDAPSEPKRPAVRITG
jgi:dTMP kinase